VARKLFRGKNLAYHSGFPDWRKLTEAVDTTSPAGRMLMQIVGIVRRVRARHVARADPQRLVGRPRKRPHKAVAAPSLRHGNKRKLSTWSIPVRKWPPIPRAYSMSIRPQWRDCWPAASSQNSWGTRKILSVRFFPFPLFSLLSGPQHFAGPVRQK
jgi:hypothetical protein